MGATEVLDWYTEFALGGIEEPTDYPPMTEGEMFRFMGEYVRAYYEIDADAVYPRRVVLELLLDQP